MAKGNKKKRRLAAGVHERPDGRIEVRASRRCPITGAKKDARRVLPAGTSLLEALTVQAELLASLEADSAVAEAEPEVITVADHAESWLRSRGRV